MRFLHFFFSIIKSGCFQAASDNGAPAGTTAGFSVRFWICGTNASSRRLYSVLFIARRWFRCAPLAISDSVTVRRGEFGPGWVRVRGG